MAYLAELLVNLLWFGQAVAQPAESSWPTPAARAIARGYSRPGVQIRGEGAAVFGHDWEPAEGTCIDIRVKAHGDPGTDNRRWLMEVRCGDAEPFRVELGFPGFHGNFMGPARGHTCKMHADVKRHEAKWDLDDPALSWKTERQKKQVDFQSELAAKPWADEPGN